MHKYDLHFFTATNLEWKMVLESDRHKDIVISSLRFLSLREKIFVVAFAIMNNHLHLLWHIREPYKLEDVQRDFLKYTAQQIKRELVETGSVLLNELKVDAKDRQYQIWERNPLCIPIWTEDVLLQKLEYIHNNPVKAGLCERAQDYAYSSAAFYESGEDRFGFLHHYRW